jgi:anti-anti-sigma regulatory factor
VGEVVDAAFATHRVEQPALFDGGSDPRRRCRGGRPVAWLATTTGVPAHGSLLRREADFILSIDIRRELATVVVTLEGLLDEDSSPALAALLWDLVVGQGNLSVTIDARHLTLSDPVLVWMFQALEREADLRGGTLALVERSPPRAPTAQEMTATALDEHRARRVHAMARAAHPARGQRPARTE